MHHDPVLSLLLWFPAFLFSITVHEAAHAWVALRGGDPTAYRGGQVTLWPWPHIRREPIGMVVVPVITSLAYGWAMGWASAPYDPKWADEHPRAAARMAAAGPAGNFAIALAALLLTWLGLTAGWFVAPDSATFEHVVVAAARWGSPGGPLDFVASMLSVLLVLNVLLGVFNLLPIPPLDGASALGLVLPEGAAVALRRMAAFPGFSLIGLFVAWRLFPRLVDPLFTLLLNLVHPGQYPG
jgi:Zn-dependent protease